METGLFVSLREKIARTPLVAGLFGIPQTRVSILRNLASSSDRYDTKEVSKNYSLATFDERIKQLRELRTKGIDRLLVYVSGWPNLGYDRQHPDPLPPPEKAGGWEGMKRLINACRELGYQVILHDQYRDYYLDAPSYNDQFAVHEEDESLPPQQFPGSRFGDSKQGRIPMMRHWDGGPQAYLNARFQLGHLVKNCRLFTDNGIKTQGIYIDVIGYVPPDQDFNPEHPTTHTDAMRGQIAMMNWSRQNLGIVATESGADWVIPYVDVINQSGGGSKAILVPLYQLIYHDAVITSFGSRDQKTLLQGTLWQASDFLCKASLQLALCVLFLFTAHPVTAQDAVFDRARVLKAANKYLTESPITITASTSPRSAGGLHDFFSEGDYWWPDPQNPDGPYIQRDGMTNPNNFVNHRKYLMRLSVQVPALVAAWKLTKDERYSKHAVKHLRAWFIDEKTRMNPDLQFAQAIHGRFTGRGIGIIDTIHLVEVAQAIEVLKDSNALSMNDLGGLMQWFTEYLKWMTTSKNGIDEREAKNNHGTCWVMQVAAFARLVGEKDLLEYCRNRFKTVLVPNQIALDGSFPEELRRTKPYGYSLFNLDAFATICALLSTRSDNLWAYSTTDGRSVAKAVAYMYPYIKDKKSWPMKPDVMYDSEWPMRHVSLLFAGRALNRPEYIALWKTLPADSYMDEVVRNFFIRQPILWN